MILRHLVLNEVLKHEQISVSQMLALVGKHIPAAKAAAAGRRMRRRLVSRAGNSRLSVTDLGRKHLVNHVLCELLRQHRIRRVSKGVYGPPLPKLFEAS